MVVCRVQVRLWRQDPALRWPVQVSPRQQASLLVSSILIPFYFKWIALGQTLIPGQRAVPVVVAAFSVAGGLLLSKRRMEGNPVGVET